MASRFAFGLELEAITTDSLQAIVDAIVSANIEGVQVQQYQAGVDPEYRVWQITFDTSIEVSKSAREKGIEIISPILEDDEENRVVWRRFITQILQAIVSNPKVHVYISKNCGFHLHVGVGRQAWQEFTLEELKKICMLFVLYEEAIDAMHPLHRSGLGTLGKWCKSNRRNPFFVHLPSIDAILKHILDAPTFNVLLCRMCPHRACVDLSGRSDPTQSDRDYKLNLCSVNVHRTVEFRQHQGTLDPSVVCKWTEFVLAFTRKVISLPTEEICRLDPTTTPLIPNIVADGPPNYA